MPLTNHQKMVNAAIEYDRKQEGKAGYNRYALAQYLMAITSAEEDVAAEMPMREAITSHFLGRLADKMLKAVGEKSMTKEERQAQ